MVVIPGLTDLLAAVGKRVNHFETSDSGLAVDVASTVRSARCPKCLRRSSRQHGQCRRRIRAEPCMGLPVSLGVEMRRFKCLNRQCSQATFAEQIDVLALPKQRRTIGLDEAWRSIAQALGGSAASRLSATLGMPTSRDTLLRGLRRLGRNVTPATPVVVGIDDWAITRGHRYGTIVVDLERRCPIEVLDGRESTSVADWLQRHPSIMLVARDRAGAYSDAVQSVIPHAQQVAVERSNSVTAFRMALPRRWGCNSDTFAGKVCEANLSIVNRPKEIRHFVAFQQKIVRKVLIHEGIFATVSGAGKLAATSRFKASDGLQSQARPNRGLLRSRLLRPVDQARSRPWSPRVL